MKYVIVGTAGHIDHGKTSLVKALTGVDADRLKEEKQRGITIDIGFADLAIGDYRFGFVDVPGHERFVKNMLAGAHGLDLVMLVVAADESVMPQTREHFDICRLLQVKSGLVALTKTDMVDEDLLELARAEVEDFVAGSFLEGAPIIAVSSRTGAGVEELQFTLAQLASEVEPKTAAAVPRLPIDRAFSIKGFGTVVTGTLIAGEMRVGDEVEILPQGMRTRVRNLQVHAQDTERAQAGQRTAVNLQGVDVEQIERGSVLAPAGRLRPTSMLDVRLDLLESLPRPVSHRARVRLHHGTAEVMARVALFGVASGEGLRPLEAGESRIVQLRLEQPILALPGDRFIIRSYSPQVTVGGGVVIDALPEKHRLREQGVAPRLERLESANETDRIAIFLEMAGKGPMTLAELAARTGGLDSQIIESANELRQNGSVLEVSSSPPSFLTAAAYRELAKGVLDRLAAYHKREPLSLGLNREEVREQLFGGLQPEVFRLTVAGLAEEGKLIAERDTLRLASHRPALGGEDLAAKQKLEAAIQASGLQAFTLEEISQKIGLRLELARKLYHLLLAEGRVVRIGDMVFYANIIDDLKTRVRARKSVSPVMDIAIFKEITGGLSRKHAIPLLEFLDRERITRRVGNEREIL